MPATFKNVLATYFLPEKDEPKFKFHLSNEFTARNGDRIELLPKDWESTNADCLLAMSVKPGRNRKLNKEREIVLPLNSIVSKIQFGCDYELVYLSRKNVIYGRSQYIKIEENPTVKQTMSENQSTKPSDGHTQAETSAVNEVAQAVVKDLINEVIANVTKQEERMNEQHTKLQGEEGSNELPLSSTGREGQVRAVVPYLNLLPLTVTTTPNIGLKTTSLLTPSLVTAPTISSKPTVYTPHPLLMMRDDSKFFKFSTKIPTMMPRTRSENCRAVLPYNSPFHIKVALLNIDNVRKPCRQSTNATTKLPSLVHLTPNIRMNTGESLRRTKSQNLVPSVVNDVDKQVVIRRPRYIIPISPTSLDSRPKATQSSEVIMEQEVMCRNCRYLVQSLRQKFSIMKFEINDKTQQIEKLTALVNSLKENAEKFRTHLIVKAIERRQKQHTEAMKKLKVTTPCFSYADAVKSQSTSTSTTPSLDVEEANGWKRNTPITVVQANRQKDMSKEKRISQETITKIQSLDKVNDRTSIAQRIRSLATHTDRIENQINAAKEKIDNLKMRCKKVEDVRKRQMKSKSATTFDSYSKETFASLSPDDGAVETSSANGVQSASIRRRRYGFRGLRLTWMNRNHVLEEAAQKKCEKRTAAVAKHLLAAQESSVADVDKKSRNGESIAFYVDEANIMQPLAKSKNLDRLVQKLFNAYKEISNLRQRCKRLETVAAAKVSSKRRIKKDEDYKKTTKGKFQEPITKKVDDKRPIAERIRSLATQTDRIENRINAAKEKIENLKMRRKKVEVVHADQRRNRSRPIVIQTSLPQKLKEWVETWSSEDIKGKPKSGGGNKMDLKGADASFSHPLSLNDVVQLSKKTQVENNGIGNIEVTTTVSLPSAKSSQSSEDGSSSSSARSPSSSFVTVISAKREEKEFRESLESSVDAEDKHRKQKKRKSSHQTFQKNKAKTPTGPDTIFNPLVSKNAEHRKENAAIKGVKHDNKFKLKRPFVSSCDGVLFTSDKQRQQRCRKESECLLEMQPRQQRDGPDSSSQSESNNDRHRQEIPVEFHDAPVGIRRMNAYLNGVAYADNLRRLNQVACRRRYVVPCHQHRAFPFAAPTREGANIRSGSNFCQWTSKQLSTAMSNTWNLVQKIAITATTRAVNAMSRGLNTVYESSRSIMQSSIRNGDNMLSKGTKNYQIVGSSGEDETSAGTARVSFENTIRNLENDEVEKVASCTSKKPINRPPTPIRQNRRSIYFNKADLFETTC